MSEKEWFDINEREPEELREVYLSFTYDDGDEGVIEAYRIGSKFWRRDGDNSTPLNITRDQIDGWRYKEDD